MPDNNKLLAVFLLITVTVCALPFIMAWPTGLSGVSVANGALNLIERIPLLLAGALIGISATFLTRDGVVLIPVCYLLTYVLGNMLSLGVDAYPFFHVYVFGTILLFGITLTLASHRSHLVLAILCSSIGFQFGIHFSSTLMQNNSPLYFLLGEIIALGLLLSVAVSFGLITIDLVLRWLLPDPNSPNEYDAS